MIIVNKKLYDIQVSPGMSKSFNQHSMPLIYVWHPSTSSSRQRSTILQYQRLNLKAKFLNFGHHCGVITITCSLRKPVLQHKIALNNLEVELFSNCSANFVVYICIIHSCLLAYTLQECFRLDINGDQSLGFYPYLNKALMVHQPLA